MNYRNNDKIFRAANDKYSGNQTMIATYNAQLSELDKNSDMIYRAFLNNFVKYANIEGVRRFEAIFNIQADEETESLELRKARILQKFTELPPFTKIFIEEMLTNLFGEDMWEFNIDYDHYKTFIGIETDIEGLLEETLKSLRQIIPANMIMETIIYVPYIHAYLKRHYTHSQLAEFTQGELSSYA